MIKCEVCNISKDITLFPKVEYVIDGSVYKSCRLPIVCSKCLDPRMVSWRLSKLPRISSIITDRIPRTEELKKLYREKSKNYSITNKEKLKIKNKERQRGIYYKILTSSRSKIPYLLKTPNRECKMIGCSGIKLVEHLESQFKDGMTWDNHGTGYRIDEQGNTTFIKEWQIDHIKPVCQFNLLDPEQLKRVHHYTNLQPLWSEENLAKPKKEIINLKADKQCTKCGQILGLEKFSKQSATPDGLRYSCKDCNKKTAETHYIQNRSTHIEKVLKWQSANPDKVSEYKKRYNGS